MVAKVRNVPHLPVFNDTGQIANAGQLKLYVSGTSTPKVAYKNATKTTEYGSTIDLDSSGRPEDGPIYFDGIYKVEIYTNDGDGTYTLLDTVDPFGDNDSAIINAQGSTELLNGSGETDSDSDGDPDYWTITDSGSVVSLSNTAPWHGGYSFKFTNSQNGSDYGITNYYPISEDKKLVLSFAIKAANANAEPKIEVLWADKDQAAISTQTIYHGNDGATPTSWTDIYYLYKEAPATAAYYRLKMYGNVAATQYTVEFDDLRVSQKFASDTDAPVIPSGLIMSRDAGDTDHDINITSGVVLDSTKTEAIVLKNEITKRLDATWAKGDDAGGLAAGASLGADSIIYGYLIKNTTSGAVDAVFDTNDPVTGPTLPSGYDIYRYIGAWGTDASNNLQNGVMFGNKWIRKAALTDDVNDGTLTDKTFETATAVAPPNSIVDYIARVENTGLSNDIIILIRPSDSSWDANFLGNGIDFSSQILDEVTFEGQVPVDASSQYDYAVNWDNGSGTHTLWIKITGWTDLMRNTP